MKNKQVTYALIGVVLVVWGLIVYRIIHGMSDEEVGLSAPSSIQAPIQGQQESDTFELLLGYRDPFLGMAVNRPVTDVTKRKSVRKAIVLTAPPPVTDWSFVSYHGTIRNTRTKKEIGILTLRGAESMVSNNDKLGDVTILKVCRDSVLLRHQGATKWLYKSH